MADTEPIQDIQFLPEKPAPRRSRKGGPVMQPVDRVIRWWPVTETEFSAIGRQNALATLFWSLASFCASLCLGMLWDIFMSDSGAPEKANAAWLVFAGAAVVMVLFAIAAITTTVLKHKAIKEIKSKAEETPLR